MKPRLVHFQAFETEMPFISRWRSTHKYLFDKPEAQGKKSSLEVYGW